MEKIIWVMESDRAAMLDIQRKINAFGGMRTMCILSVQALQKTIDERLSQGSSLSNPSLIMIDYKMTREDAELLKIIKINPKLAGVPLFFIVDDGEDVTKEDYYIQGAMVVLNRPITQNGILRIERAAWQYETTRSYEKIFQKQVNELEAAKEIQRLNVQLESRNQFLYRLFGKYFSDDLLEVILGRPDGEFIGGDRREIAVLVADLRGFSSKAEEMAPDDMMDLLNCFFGSMVDIISKYGGTVIEFMGDGILAVFGAPMRNEKYAASAIVSAIEMQNAMQKVNEFCKRRGTPELEMGVGVHCGEAFIGNVGSEKMMRYNVIGRVVNECSRIEGCSVGGQVLVSQDTIDKLNCEVQVVNRAQIAAKGIKEPIQICEISGIGGEYNCHLSTTENAELVRIEQEIVLELFPIQNKVVSAYSIPVLLKEFSMYNAVVKCRGDYEIEEYISVFADVEVRFENKEHLPVFTGVYAKVLQREGNLLWLRFTHWNQEFKEFAMRVEGTTMVKDEKRSISIEQITVEEMKDISGISESAERICTLFWAKDGEDIRILFCSNDKRIRALEFMDYLVENYAMVRGNGDVAQAVITPVFLQVMMSELEVNDVQSMLEKIVELYHTRCQWIYATDYARENRDAILKMPVYVKKHVPWAFVKSVDIVEAGEKFRLKSLENESDLIIEASEDTYIMIGFHGEIYHINRAKFERTYEITDEKLDVYEQMLDYLPEVRKCQDDSFVCLDELAHLCYPKKVNGIYAIPLERRAKVFNPYMQGEYFVGREGDYLAIRKDDLEDIYIIQKEILGETYEIES